MSPNDDLSDLSLDEIEEGLKKPGPKRGKRRAKSAEATASQAVSDNGSRKSRRFTFFMVGLLLGVGGTLFLPPLIRPYLPDALLPRGEEVSGPVLGKQREAPDRLLITLQAQQGAILATFTEQVAEIDLLVGVGDTVTLGVEEYQPFVENPRFEGIRKASSPPAGSSGLDGSEPQMMEPQTTDTQASESGDESQSADEMQTPGDTTTAR